MKNFFVISLFLVLCSCASEKKANQDSRPLRTREYQIGAYLWQQTSAEYRALTYQAYNIAKEKIQRELEDKHNRKRAVIFDIDETVLDNSLGGATEIKNKVAWNTHQFSDWVKLKKAVAIPGALDFIKFLTENRVEVFYISNRKIDMFDDTYENLVKEGFPVKKSNLLLMGEVHTKEPRRLQVEKDFKIVMLVGDNLADFHKDYDKTTVEKRAALTDEMKNEFGSRFIILPNPLYGDWENALGFEKDKIDLLKVLP